jgi:molybdenum cofactor cytidylyltransferase
VNPRIADLVLAAGTSSRMAGRNKLLCEIGGITMIERAVRAALDSRCAEVVVVTGWQAERVEATLAAVARSKPMTIVRNAHYEAGLAGSLRCAVGQLPDSIDAAVVQLADMPWIASEHIDRLIETFTPEKPSIVVPVRDGRRGHPVLWPRRYFSAICNLTGDVGARELLVQYADEVRAVSFETNAIFADIDTPDELAGALDRPTGPAPGSPMRPEWT